MAIASSLEANSVTARAGTWAESATTDSTPPAHRINCFIVFSFTGSWIVPPRNVGGLVHVCIISRATVADGARKRPKAVPLLAQEMPGRAVNAESMGARVRRTDSGGFRRCVPALPVLQLGAQPRDRLAVQLAHARFGHSHYRSDLAQVHVLLVVHAHQLPFPLGQLFDGTDQGASNALVAQDVGRVGAVDGDMSLQVIVVVVAAAQVVEIPPLGAARLVQGFLVMPDLQAHFAGDLGLGRRALQALLESMDRVFDISLALACRARQPIAGPQLVKHRSANPAGRVDLERGPVGLLEPVDRIHQADHPGLNHVVQFDVGRQPCDHLVRNATHQRRVLLCAIILTLERAARVVDESLVLQETVSTAVSPARSQRGMLRQRTRRTRRSIAETSCTLPASDVLAPSSRAPLAASLE